jgi:hypothetical protein
LHGFSNKEFLNVLADVLIAERRHDESIYDAKYI